MRFAATRDLLCSFWKIRASRQAPASAAPECSGDFWSRRLVPPRPPVPVIDGALLPLLWGLRAASVQACASWPAGCGTLGCFISVEFSKATVSASPTLERADLLQLEVRWKVSVGSAPS